MYLQKVKAENFFTKFVFVGILKVYDENSMIRIQDPDPNPDLLVRGSVADPDPGSGIGAFLTPGSGIRDPE
jgi:hypothetical protein